MNKQVLEYFEVLDELIIEINAILKARTISKKRLREALRKAQKGFKEKADYDYFCDDLKEHEY
jgi:hypothetical protein